MRDLIGIEYECARVRDLIGIEIEVTDGHGVRN